MKNLSNIEINVIAGGEQCEHWCTVKDGSGNVILGVTKAAALSDDNNDVKNAFIALQKTIGITETNRTVTLATNVSTYTFSCVTRCT